MRRGAAPIIPTIMVTVSGSSAAPLANAPSPRTCCRYRLRKKNIGIHAAPSRNWAALAAARFGALKIPSRTSGSRSRACMATKSASSARPPSPAASVDAEVQPASGARTTANTTAASPAVTVAALGRSRLPRRVTPAGSTERVHREDGDGQGDVDEEHPGPGGVLGQDAAEEHTGGASGGCRGAVQRQRLGELLR